VYLKPYKTPTFLSCPPGSIRQEREENEEGKRLGDVHVTIRNSNTTYNTYLVYLKPYKTHTFLSGLQAASDNSRREEKKI